MGRIILQTRINSTPEICFDLSTSIDLHKISTKETLEEAIAGRTSGLIKSGETVTWRARHFGFWFTLTSKVIRYERPSIFADEMIEGPFKKMHHTHEFMEDGSDTLLKDTFVFCSPLGILGKIADTLILDEYLRRFLTKRNELIKEYAESGKWKQIMENSE